MYTNNTAWQRGYCAQPALLSSNPRSALSFARDPENILGWYDLELALIVKLGR
jgi:hypothetical protein